MKALHLNLASRPYSDDRPFYAGVAVVALLIAFLMLQNVQTAMEYISATKNTRAEMADLERSIAAEQKSAADADARIKRIDLKALNIRAAYVNSEIAVRAFSWSALLDLLEQVLPKDVRIVSLNPSVNKDGSTHLRLTCETKTGNGLIDLLRRLLADSHFARPFPNSESRDATGLQQFAIEVDYRPDGNTAVIEAQP